MTYSEKLRDPRWQKKRLSIMQREGFKCQACGRSNETLNVHHLWYSKEPWAVSDELLECLCETCHAAREDVNSMERWMRETRPTKEVITAEARANFLAMFDIPPEGKFSDAEELG